MQHTKTILIFFLFLFIYNFTFSQGEFSERPKHAPWGEKHKNVSDNKGKQGTWKFFSNDKILVYEITYKNDIMHGPCSKYYFSSGIIREESNYYYGKRDGEFKSYYNNGQISAEGTYKDGKKTGAWITYYKSSGEKKSEGAYINGDKDGVWISYDNKGVKSAQGKYVMDIKEGDWETYDSEGKILEVRKYINGFVQYKEDVQKPTTTNKKSNKINNKNTTTKPVSKGPDNNVNTKDQAPLNAGEKEEKKTENPQGK